MSILLLVQLYIEPGKGLNELFLLNFLALFLKFFKFRKVEVLTSRLVVVKKPVPQMSGQAVQPKLLASLKLSMAVYGQKLDGRPSR